MAEKQTKVENQAGKRITWSPITSVFIALAIYFGGQILGGVLVAFIPLLKGWNESQANDWLENSTIAQFLLYTAIAVVTLALLKGFLHYKKTSFKVLGLIKPKLRDIGYAILGFAAYLPLYILAISILRQFIPTINLDQPQQIGFQHASGWPELSLVFVSLVVLPPLMEEILVRGFLYTGLRSKLPILQAAILTSVLFGAAHLQAGMGEPLLWVAGIDTFVLSLVLIYLREKTGGLWASIGLHALKNFVAFFILFVFRVA